MPSPKSYELGCYRLRFPAGLLYRNTEMVPLPPKAAQVLRALVENAAVALADRSTETLAVDTGGSWFKGVIWEISLDLKGT